MSCASNRGFYVMNEAAWWQNVCGVGRFWLSPRKVCVFVREDEILMGGWGWGIGRRGMGDRQEDGDDGR